MAFGDDYGLEKPAGMVELGSGAVVNATAVLRKTGINDSDVAFLVGVMQAGHSWQEARRSLIAKRGAVDNAALEGWKKEVHRRAALDPNRHRTVKELTSLDIVLPAARHAREQCIYVFSGLPPDTCRCILRKHTAGGHMPGRPIFAGGQIIALPGDQAAPAGDGARLAASPKEQCRHVAEDGDHEGTRCVLAMHDEVEVEHVFDAALVKPAKSARAPRAAAPAKARKPKKAGRPKAAKRAARARPTQPALEEPPAEDQPPFAPDGEE